MTELCDRTASELAAALRAGECSAVDILESSIGRIDAVDGRVGAFLARTDELAREQARAADARIAAGDAPGVAGLPLALKDVLSTRGVATTCGSKILEAFVPPRHGDTFLRLAALLRPFLAFLAFLVFGRCGLRTRLRVGDSDKCKQTQGNDERAHRVES